MTRFLIFYFAAYGGAHGYFYLKVVRGVALSRRSKRLLSAVLLLLFIAPLAARSLETLHGDLLAEILSNTGYLWMGLLFLFVTAAAAIDSSNFILSRLGRLCKRPAFRVAITPTTHLQLALAYSLIIGLYGYYEATAIKTEQLTITSSKIPKTVERIRIVQLSDVHIGQIIRAQRVHKILAVVSAAAPDILVSTGDLLDGHQRHFKGIERLFAEIKPPLGKFAIVGNHEYYVGLDRAVEFMKAGGFKILINENFKIGETLCLTGVDDSRNKSQRMANAVIEERLLREAGNSEFRLLLKHRPVVAPYSAGMFDLQLSGHVHKGQIFPFNFLTWLSFPVKTGLTELAKGHYLYVSRGTGVWGPPIRFLAPPEVTVIDLLPDKASK